MLQASHKNCSPSAWRHADAAYRQPINPEYEHVPGNISFSPGSFQIGHSVCSYFTAEK